MAKSPFKSRREPKSAQGTSEQEISFAEREAELAARQAELDAREVEHRHADHVSFADSLVADARLPSGNKDKVVALLDGAADLDADEIEFADGNETKKAVLADLLKDVLKTQPKIVEFGEVDLGDAPNGDEPDASTIADEALAFHASQREKGIEVSTSAAVTYARKKRGLDG